MDLVEELQRALGQASGELDDSEPEPEPPAEPESEPEPEPEPAPELHDLSLDLLDRVLAHVDTGTALACIECTCKILWQRAADDELWHSLTLARWSWLVITPPSGRSWRWFFARLHTGRAARYCVIGGAPADGPVDGTGYALELSLKAPADATDDGAAAAWQWSALPPLQQERNMPAVVRESRSGALLAFGGLGTGPGAAALRSAERLVRNSALDDVASGDISTTGCASCFAGCPRPAPRFLRFCMRLSLPFCPRAPMTLI
jgi:hypothetical protein